MVEVRYIHDGEWAQVSCGSGVSIAVYPRDWETQRRPTTFSIGRPDAPGCWRDLDRQTGFENMQAAIDQAVWLAEEPDMLRQVWS